MAIPQPATDTGAAVAAPSRPTPGAVPVPVPAPAAGGKPDGSYELPPFTPLAAAAPPQRRASRTLVEQGRALLKAEKYKAALARFEQAIGLDAANPYAHYFIARAHYFLENYRDSANFLDVAVARAPDAAWLAEVHVLRALNDAAIGFHERADVNYVRALTVNRTMHSRWRDSPPSTPSTTPGRNHRHSRSPSRGKRPGHPSPGRYGVGTGAAGSL